MLGILKEKTMDYLYKIQWLYSFTTYRQQGSRMEKSLMTVPRSSSDHRASSHIDMCKRIQIVYTICIH